MHLVAASLLLLLQASHGKVLPCKLDDANCIKDSLQEDVIGKFSNGFPKFGVKPLDPLQFDNLTFNYRPAVGVEVVLTHIEPILYGLAKSHILDVRTQVSGSHFSMEVHSSIPKLFYEGSYTCKGKFLFFPVDWSGKFNMSLGGINDTWKMAADIMQRDNDTYLDIQEFSLSPSVTNFSMYASGVFGRWEEAGGFAVSITNKYWKHFVDVMWGLAEPEVTKKMSEVARRFLFQTPVEPVNSL